MIHDIKYWTECLTSGQWDRLAGNDSTLRNLHPQGNTIAHPALETSQEHVHSLMVEYENDLVISFKEAEF